MLLQRLNHTYLVLLYLQNLKTLS